VTCERFSVKVNQRLSRGSVSLERHQWSGLLAEVMRAEMIGNKVQDSKTEGLKGMKMGGAHSPARGALGNSNELKRIISSRLAKLEVS
jgi:hypothetical protein